MAGSKIVGFTNSRVPMSCPFRLVATSSVSLSVRVCAATVPFSMQCCSLRNVHLSSPSPNVIVHRAVCSSNAMDVGGRLVLGWVWVCFLFESFWVLEEGGEAASGLPAIRTVE